MLPSAKKKLSRRGFLEQAVQKSASATGLLLGGALGGAASTMLTSCSRSMEGGERQVNILNWADYLHPDAISTFEKRYKIQVVQDTFASNEALLAKLQAGGTRYDVIVPSSYMVKQLKKLDIMSPLEHDKIKGLTNLLPRFQSPSYDRGLQISVPYTWGTTGIGFNLDLVEKAMQGSAVASLDLTRNLAQRLNQGLAWDMLWNDKFKGRLTMLEDSREVIGTALKMQGHSYNTTDEGLIKTATELLKKQKPLVMCYTSDQVIVELASGDSLISQVYSGDCYQARRENKNLRYVIPSDGCSIWTDNFCIPRSAPHKDFAYLWINYMLEPDVAAACANFTHYATANEKAFEKVDAELVADPNLYPGAKVLERCEEIADVGNALFYYDRMWTELKCS